MLSNEKIIKDLKKHEEVDIPELRSQLETMTKYNEHKLPTKKYLGHDIEYIISCFGDSITAGDFNEPIISNRYPHVLERLISENGYIKENKIIGVPITQEGSTKVLSDTTYQDGIFTLTSVNSNNPRFLGEEIALSDDSNYLVEFELDTRNMGSGNCNLRIGYSTGGGMLAEDDMSEKFTEINQSIKISAYLDMVAWKNIYPSTSKITFGLKLNQANVGESVIVKNMVVYKTNVISNNAFPKKYASVGLSMVNKKIKLTATTTEKKPRFATEFRDITEDMKTKSYVLRADITKTIFREEDVFETRLWLNNNNSFLVDMFKGVEINKDGRCFVDFYFNMKDLLKKYPTANKLCYGARLSSKNGDSSIIINSLEIIETTNYIGVYNDGVSGDTTVNGLARLQTVLDKKPNICFVAFGTNDIRNGISLEEYLNNIKSIITSLKSINCEPIIATLPPLGTNQTNHDKVESWNNEIKYFAVKNGCRVWDRYWHFEDGDLKYIVDDRHPGTIGYRVLGETSFGIVIGELNN